MARFLIIDDSELSRFIVREALEEAGHTIVGDASDGAEGFEKFKELRPDITTLDITMPVMDGIETLERILEIDPNAKVIMLSASAQNSKISEALILGAFEFLQKPFEKELLLQIVSDILSGAQ
ncbi:MAG: response regulator [Oscillospiraceae bacterium]|nr:response regulator [Oscillospiraceae bacterium]